MTFSDCQSGRMRLYAACGGDRKHVVFTDPLSTNGAPILRDIQNCNLPAISWVIPDEAWSDHPGPKDKGLGPSWVAAIVNAIGNATACDKGAGYWSDTAIFITWDDWGGFYDHVPPPVTYTGTYDPITHKWTCPAPNGWGCGYVYGFRVPLLVVSAYTPPGTVSGRITLGKPTYPPLREWTHDFGSILKFTENNFLGPTAQIAPSGYTYADQNSLDSGVNHEWVPLWEFFLANPPRGFTNISPTDPTYDANYFMNYYTTQQPDGTTPTPTGPDGGDDD